jgi:hypothetical protein
MGGGDNKLMSDANLVMRGAAGLALDVVLRPLGRVLLVLVWRHMSTSGRDVDNTKNRGRLTEQVLKVQRVADQARGDHDVHKRVDTALLAKVGQLVELQRHPGAM